MHQEPCEIFEIGCGAGFSTLAFAIRDFSVVAIDFNEIAIKITQELLQEYDYNAMIFSEGKSITDDVDVCLWKMDLIHEFAQIRTLIGTNGVFSPDIIVLCNPGGQLTTTITKQEQKYLLWGGFTEREIIDQHNAGNVGLLHKWAMIYAACGLAQLVDKPIMIIDRGTRSEVQGTLEQIQKDTEIRKVSEAYRVIRNAPQNGIALSGLEDERNLLFWGAGRYDPR